MPNPLIEAGTLGGCVFCGYNGQHYYQEGTHARSCPWYDIGGLHERSRALHDVVRALYLRAIEAERERDELRDAVSDTWRTSEMDPQRMCVNLIKAYRTDSETVEEFEQSHDAMERERDEALALLRDLRPTLVTAEVTAVTHEAWQEAAGMLARLDALLGGRDA